MNPIDTLAELFERFPGIGPRQARRFVQFLLGEKTSFRSELTSLIKDLGSHTGQCSECFRWFVRAKQDTKKCPICSNTSRDKSLLFVLEKDADIPNVERSGFTGQYFVLGGVIPLAAEHPEKHIRIEKLLQRVERDGNILKEIILGLSATKESDHTRLILMEKLRPLMHAKGLKLSSLGRGLSTGSELEYADPETIEYALRARNEED